MKTTRIALCSASLAAVVALAAGCVVTATPYGVAVQPEVGVAVATPPPSPAVVTVGPVAPEYYVWDGYEYVGWCNGAYVYWSGGAWLACPPVVLGRFGGWARYHPGWRAHAFRYEHGRAPHR